MTNGLTAVAETSIEEFNQFESNLAEFKKRYDDVVYDLTIPKEEAAARSDRLAIGTVPRCSV